MVLKMFCVYDSRVKAYLQPFFVQHVGHAVRSFEQESMNPSSNFSRYPAEFTLFEIGGFDEDTGTVTLLDAKVSHGTALERRPKQDELPLFPKAVR